MIILAIFGSKNRRIDIDIVANDKSTGVFNSIASGANSMSGRINSGIENLNSGLHRYNNAMNSLYRSTQVAMVASGYLVYNFTQDSIKQFAEFERQHGKTMGAIASNYDKTAESQKRFLDDQKKLKDESIKLGTFGPNGNGALYNPTEVSYAQTSLSKSGVKVDDISAVLPDILKFAGGNDLQIETASDYAVNLATMFDVPQKKWKEMLDMVTKAADMSTIDTPDIFESLKYAGPVASALGKSLEDVLGMLVIMGNSGIKGSMGGTGIQSFMTRILNPVGANEKALETAPTENVKNKLSEFVNTTTDGNGKFKEMPELTDMLNSTMEGLSDKEQAWFAYRLFGLFQMKSGLTLAKGGGGNLQGVIDDIVNTSAGTNDTKWDTMLGTSWGKQEALKNVVTGIQTDVGSRLSPVTNAIVDELFNVLANKGNYNINFSKLKKAIEEAGDLIGEQYGDQLGNFTKNVGNFAIDGSRIAYANEPILEGFMSGASELLSGDFISAFSSIGDSVQKANDRINELPPELQGMAKQVRNAALALATLAGVNFAARLLENLTSLYTNTIGRMIKANSMNVSAATVIIKDTGIVDANGKKIYRQEEVETKGGKNTKGGGGSSGGSSGGGVVGGTKQVIVDKDGKKISSKNAPVPSESVILDKYGKEIKPSGSGGTIVGTNGKPISSDKSAGTGAGKIPSFGTKLGKGLSIASWAYSLSEMFGVNDRILNGIGLTEGTKGREAVDTGRTALNWGLTMSFVDDMLAGGAAKRLGREFFGKFVSEGGKQAMIQMPSVMKSALSATSNSIAGSSMAGGAASVAAPALAVAGTALAFADMYEYGKRWEKNQEIYAKAQEEGRPTYLTGEKELGVGFTEAEKKYRLSEAKYNFRGTIGGDGVAFEQAQPNKYLHPFKYQDWLESQAKTKSVNDQEQRIWNYAKTQYQAATGGSRLTWQQYEDNRDKWVAQFNQSILSTVNPLEKFKKSLETGIPLNTKVATPMPTVLDASRLGIMKNDDGSLMTLAQKFDMLIAQWKSDNAGTVAVMGSVGQSVMNMGQSVSNAVATNNNTTTATITGKVGEVGAKVDKVDETTSSIKSTVANQSNEIKMPYSILPKGASGDTPTLQEFLLNMAKGTSSGGGSELNGKVDTLNQSILGVKDGQTPISTTLSNIYSTVPTAGDTNTRLDSVNSNIVALQNQPPPTVNVSPPNVSVNVNVDKSGNVTKNQYITDASPLDKVFKQESRRFGG